MSNLSNNYDPSLLMQAAVLEQFKEPYVQKTVPRPPRPTGQDIVIKVLAASYCHTDAVFASGNLDQSQSLPRVGCHEFAGQVVALGPDVPSNGGISLGARVGVPGRAYHPCGRCYECTHTGGDPHGYSPYCPRAGSFGFTRDGGFQEYCLVDSRQVVLLPDGLSATQAAPLMCAGITIWTAINHEKIKDAERIGIIGAGGGLGHLGVQFGARLGKHVVAVDAQDQAIQAIEDIKADLGPEDGARVYVADARNMKTAQVKCTAQDTEGLLPSERGLDAVIMLPESQNAFDLGMELLRNHGTMVVVSFPKEKLAVSASDLVFRDISLVGSLVGRNHQLREMLEFMGGHKVVVKTKTFALRDLNELVSQSHEAAGGKLVVDMSS